MRTHRRELEQRLKHPLADRLVPILLKPTGRSSAGYPFLRRDAWESFRDTIPHLFAMGLEVLRAIEEVEQTLEQLDVPAADRESLSNACRVTRQVVLTATITAPCDLWLLRHVLGFFGELGLLERLLSGEPLYPEPCTVRFEGRKRRLSSHRRHT